MSMDKEPSPWSQLKKFGNASHSVFLFFPVPYSSCSYHMTPIWKNTITISRDYQCRTQSGWSITSITVQLNVFYNDTSAYMWRRWTIIRASTSVTIMQLTTKCFLFTLAHAQCMAVFTNMQLSDTLVRTGIKTNPEPKRSCGQTLF